MKPKNSPQGSRPVIVLLGPTAVGKTALSLLLARTYRAAIISGDSRQVYRGMDIGTGKVTKREMGGVPHYLLDVASPRTQFTVARYLRFVNNILRLLPAGQPVLLVGGSPFYLEAITNPGKISAVPPNPQLRKQLATKSATALYRMLKRLDPLRAKTIDQRNTRRLIRAIEIARGKPTPLPPLPPLRILKLGLTLPTAKLFQRIDHRVDQRMRQGMLHEVAGLRQQGLSWKRLDAFGLEYRFLSRHLRGQITKVAAIQQLKSAIHDFARRQMTWWKRDASIHWIKNEMKAVKLVRAFLLQTRK